MNDTLNQLFAADPLTTYLAAVIVLLPWVLSVLYQEQWSSAVKGAVSVAACFVAAAGWLAVHEWSTNRWVIYAVVLVGGTQAMYWALRPALKALEERTSK